MLDESPLVAPMATMDLSSIRIGSIEKEFREKGPLEISSALKRKKKL